VGEHLHRGELEEGAQLQSEVVLFALRQAIDEHLWCANVPQWCTKA
jgi:hypothetical protein